jgi:hypothetical protein
MDKKSSPIDPKSKADFDAAISQFAKDVKVDVSIITNEQMRLMLRDAMTFTPPMPKGGGRGLTTAAWKAGKNKLGNDVRRIFIPQDQPRRGMPVLLRQVINMVKGNDRQGYLALSQTINQQMIKGMSPVMRKILDDTDWERSFKKAQNYLSKANIYGNMGAVAGMTNELESIHDKYKGKVGGRWPKGARIGGPQYMVNSTTQLEAYIALRQLKVGRVKAAWATALNMIPPLISSKGKARNYGAYDAHWVDANKSAMGQFSMNKTADSVSMTAINLIGNINNVANDAGMENIVYGNRVKQINATVQSRLDDAIKRSNRKK